MACNQKLYVDRQPRPRTCADCGLGPCKTPIASIASNIPPLGGPVGTARIPDFEAVRDKRMSELTPEQRDDARELWIRENYGWFVGGAGGHLKFLLDRLDAARRGLTP